MKIVLGFSHGNYFISKVIKRFLNSNISHCYIKIEKGILGSNIVLHSDPGGVIIQLEEVFKSDNTVVEEYEVENPNIRSAIAKNLRHLNKKYDYLRLFGWAWTIAFRRWIKAKIRRPIENPRKLICVDLVIRILNDAGITDLKCGSMTPRDLMEWVRNNCDQLGWKKV